MLHFDRGLEVSRHKPPVYDFKVSVVLAFFLPPTLCKVVYLLHVALRFILSLIVKTLNFFFFFCPLGRCIGVIGILQQR